MAGAGQYEDAFRPHRLQNWTVAHPGPQRPSPREGSTRIIADDRGHLLPSASRSQASPWGTFVGTWEMPVRIPPVRLDLTSRSATAAAQLTEWVRQPTALTRARNGLRTEITGKPQVLRSDVQTAKEPSQRSMPASTAEIQLAGLSLGVTLEEPPDPRAEAPAAASLWHDPCCPELASLEPPASLQPHRQSRCSHEPTVTDQRGDTGSPQTPTSNRPASREASVPQAIPPPGPNPSRGHGSYGLGASPRVGCGGSAAGMRAGQTRQL